MTYTTSQGYLLSTQICILLLLDRSENSAYLQKVPNLKNTLLLPVAVPTPINEEPAFAIIALTSAKSTLTNPRICKRKDKKNTAIDKDYHWRQTHEQSHTVMLSEIPRYPLTKHIICQIECFWNRSRNRETAVSNMSFGITMRVSTLSPECCNPFLSLTVLLRPSNETIYPSLLQHLLL